MEYAYFFCRQKVQDRMLREGARAWSIGVRASWNAVAGEEVVAESMTPV
jgi:hypothetical protein